MQSAEALPASAKLFFNVVPASMYDPDFQGASLIQMLEGLGLGPDRIVLEISEKYAIENYTLFVESLHNFTDMGFSIAVDDIGAGYSGLEKVAHIKPKYLKFDMQLVRDIDASYIRQEMARALKTFADKMESTIIAEGIETRAASSRPAWSSGSTTARGTCSADPPRGSPATSTRRPPIGEGRRQAESAGLAPEGFVPSGLADEPRGFEPRGDLLFAAAVGRLVVAPPAQAIGQAIHRRRRLRPRRARSDSPCRSPGPS